MADNELVDNEAPMISSSVLNFYEFILKFIGIVILVAGNVLVNKKV